MHGGLEGRCADTAQRSKPRCRSLTTHMQACSIASCSVVGALGSYAELEECAKVRVHSMGSMTLFTGSQSHGHGHKTTLERFVRDKVGVTVESVDAVQSNTERV